VNLISKHEIEMFHSIKKHFSSHVFIDVGAFNGSWTDFVLQNFSDAEIFLFEPNNDKFSFLTKKYQSNSNIYVFNYGLSNEEKYENYYQMIDNNHDDILGMSSFVKRSIFKKYQIKINNLQVKIFDDIYRSHKEIDFMKIDVEGYELNVLKGCENMLKNKNIKFIQFEYGGTYKDNHIKLNDVIKYLNLYDYKTYKFTNSFTQIHDFEDDYNYNNFLASYEEL
jgi:FkbM family methyltransferase